MVVASALVGLVEAAGLERRPHALRRPLRVVRLDDREPGDLLARTGVWFLEPLADPRPRPGDLRRDHGPRLRLASLITAGVARGLRYRRS